jgi:hypothetical protein
MCGATPSERDGCRGIVTHANGVKKKENIRPAKNSLPHGSLQLLVKHVTYQFLLCKHNVEEVLQVQQIQGNERF